MRNSIRTRLTLAFIGVAVAPSLLVGVILAWSSFISQLMAEQAVSEAPALLTNPMYIIIAFIVTALLAAGGLGFVMVRQIVRPIETLATTARAISAGDLSQRVQTGRRDELGVLAEAFNSMTGQLGTLIAGLDREVAERKKTEETLRLTQLAVDRARDAIHWVGPDGELLYVNEATCQTLGYTREELLAMTVFDIEPSYLREMWATQWDRAREIGYYLIETTYKTKDGRLIPVEVTIDRVNYGGQEYNCAYARDITERKRTEEIIQLRLRLMEFAATHSLEELLQKTLDEVGKLTYSPIGFYHFVEADQKTLSLQAWSTRTLAEFCQAEGQGLHYPIAEAGVWVDCVRERRPVIHNDYQSLPHRKGLPEGHAPVIRELVVPIFRDDRIVAILGVGNNPQDYTETDAEVASYVADLAWEITEQKRVEEALHLTRFTVDSVADAVHWMDPEARIVDVNETACRMLGYTRQELLNLSVSDIDPVFSIDRWPDIWKQIKVTGKFALETEHRTKDGRTIPVEVIANYIEFGGRELDCAVVRDITERKRAEEALREKSEEFDRFFTVALDLLCIADTDGYFRRLNPQWEAVLGYSLPELEGQRFLDLVHPDDQASTLEALSELEAQKVVLDFVNRYRCKDGSYRWIEWRSYPVENLVYAAARDITERKQTEEALRLTQLAVDRARDAIHWVGANGELLYVNGATCHSLGYSREELLSMTIFDIDPLYPKETWADHWENERERGHYMLETVHKTKDGQLLPVEIVVDRVNYGGKEYNCAYARDITERKRVEEALQESEFFLRRSQAVARLGSYYLNVITGQWISSPALDEIFGIDDNFSKDVDGWIALVHPEQKEEMLQYLSQYVLAEHNRFDKEYRIIRYDNQGERWMHGLGELEFDESGNAIKMIGTIQDITERKQVEGALRESEERLRLALEGTTDGIWDWNLETGQQYFSSRYYTMLGYEPDEFPLADKGWRQLIHPDDVEAVEKALQDALDEHTPYAIESRLKAKNGEWRWILSRAKVVELDKQGKAVRMAGSHTDITDRKRAEEEIHRLNQELEQRVAERTAQLEAANKELEAFSYSVSHDLRAPLRAINGYTRILVEDYEPALDAEGRRVCTVIRRQTQRMGELIDDLLTFSRLGRAEMRISSIDMEAMANSVFFELTTPEERDRIEFQLEFLPPAVGDPALIRQVWANLLANAVKFSARRARAIIEVGSRQEAAENIYFVCDNGAGFDMQYTDKLFGVFQRLHSEREFEGTGVGLAIIQRIIHRHGGRVWAEGKVDQGAIFYFTLHSNGD